MWVCAIKPRTLKTIQRLWSAVWTRRKQHFLAQNKAKRKENVPKQEEETRELWRWKPFKLLLKDCLSQSWCKSLVWRRVQSLCCSFFRYSSDAKYLLVIGVFSLKRVHSRSGGAALFTPASSPPHPSSQVCSCLFSSRPAASVLSCHLLSEEHLILWLYLWMRGERECSLTNSSGNLNWGNMVSRKPSRKT